MEFVARYFAQSPFMPHGHCFLWLPDILWMHVGSDIIIALAYYSIPVALWVFVRRRKDLAFSWMFLAFAAFIFACGTTHILDAWNIWHSDYRLEGVVKVFTAIVSLGTAVMLWPLIPRALELPSPEQLRAANTELAAQVRERERAELALRALNEGLESQVALRTSELQRVNENLQQFAYIASHDLQQPLRTVANMNALIERSIGGQMNEDTRRYIRYTNEACARMTDLVRDLLAFARLGSQEAELTGVPLADVVDEAVKDAGADIGQAGIAITIGELPVVRGDRAQLRQVFANLIGNAIKYRDGLEPRIEVSAERGEDGWIFTVRDNGIGIPPEHHESIFEMFKRLHRPTEYAGTGMGLAIVKRAVENHGGRVWVDSEPGRDTEFRFTIPDHVPQTGGGVPDAPAA